MQWGKRGLSPPREEDRKLPLQKLFDNLHEFEQTVPAAVSSSAHCCAYDCSAIETSVSNTCATAARTTRCCCGCNSCSGGTHAGHTGSSASAVISALLQASILTSAHELPQALQEPCHCMLCQLLLSSAPPPAASRAHCCTDTLLLACALGFQCGA